MPRRIGTAVATAAMAFAWAVPASASANGDPADDVVRDLTITYEIDESGSVLVTETYDWDFGTREGLGFYRTLITLMGWEADPGFARSLEYSEFAASSPTGAPAQIWYSDDLSGEARLSIGAPDGSSDTRTGFQTYVISYRLDGAINPVRNQEGVSDQDEFYYNVFVDSLVPFDTVTVEVSGPETVVDVACYAGATGTTPPCDDYAMAGTTATFTSSDLERGDSFTIMAAYPAGTFSDPGPILVPAPANWDEGQAGSGSTRWNPSSQWVVDHAPWLIGALIALVAGIATIRIRRARDYRRDWTYEGLTPGTFPLKGQEATETRLNEEPPVAVRFTPPDDLRPAEADVIEDKHVPQTALAATLVDLAVRGYLAIEPIPRAIRRDDWRLKAVKPQPRHSSLRTYERELLRALFKDTDGSVTLSQLRKSSPSLIRVFTMTPKGGPVVY